MPESKADRRWRAKRDKEIRKRFFRKVRPNTAKQLAHDLGLSLSSIYRILRSR